MPFVIGVLYHRTQLKKLGSIVLRGAYPSSRNATVKTVQAAQKTYFVKDRNYGLKKLMFRENPRVVSIIKY
jgi:hypothetical protein